MPPIQQAVRLRPEVVKGNLHGIVSLYALIDEDTERTFEQDPQRVLRATYPSDALTRLLHRLQVSLSKRNADRKGNFIISGGYGSGKSHLLLTLYHLLQNPQVARDWLTEHRIDFESPDDAVVVLMPMTNLTKPGSYAPVEYLWEPIFHALGYEGFEHTGSNFPTVSDLRQAVADRQTFLIIDEIERWFMPIKDKHQAEANISFLQNLTEFARDPDNGMILLLTLLMLEPRIHNIVGRDDAFFEDLTGAPDRRKIVLHRLVDAVDEEIAAQVVEAYLDQYRPVESHVRIGDYHQYRQELLDCYPFHPATIEAVFDRYSSVARKEETSYQNSRGALYLLAHVLQETLSPTGALQDNTLLLPGDISLRVDRLVDDLVNLEPRLVEVARDNVARSVKEDIPYAAPILSTILLHSLGDPKAERQLGARFGAILLGTLRPGIENGGVTASSVQMALQDLEGPALNLHREDHPPRWRFRTEVNIVAQINRRARREVHKETAQQRIVNTLKGLVNGNVYVYPYEDIPDRRELALVLTTQRMESEAILKELYYGRAFPNGLIIVDPLQMASVIEDPDLIWMAQRIISAEGLKFDLVGDQNAQQRVIDFLEGMGGQREGLRDQLRDRYGAWRAPIYDHHNGNMTFIRVQVPLDRSAIFRSVEQRYDAAQFRENVLEEVLKRNTPPTVDDMRVAFYRQRSFAKPVWQGRPSHAPVDRAIRDLVKQAQLEIIKGGDERYICGRDPNVLQRNWTVSVPPEAHKPHFQVDKVVREVVYKRPQGLTVREVREHSQTAAREYPDGVADPSRIDAQISDMIDRGELEADKPAVTFGGGLPDDLVVRKPDRDKGQRKPKPPRMASLTLGPASVHQLKTDIIKRLDKTDTLNHVRVKCSSTLRGDDLQQQHELVGLTGDDPGDARLKLNWELNGVAISDRDQLMDLVNHLPYPGISQITITLQRTKAQREET
jgi:hypothetical protein